MQQVLRVFFGLYTSTRLASTVMKSHYFEKKCDLTFVRSANLGKFRNCELVYVRSTDQTHFEECDLNVTYVRLAGLDTDSLELCIFFMF